MANTPTTPASVASRLTDEEIERLAKDCNERAYDFGFDTLAHGDEERKADVLRDYVRLRKLNGKLKECIAKATLGVVVAPVVFKWDDSDKSWICYDAEGKCGLTTEVEESCINSMAELKRLLAEEEKGESK